MSFTLPKLSYAMDALAPHMSQETLEFHHGKHHQAYVDKCNELVPASPFNGQSLEEIVKNSFDKTEHAGLFNNASQHWNHIMFWQWMAPDKAKGMPGSLESAIKQSFGDVEKFKAEFVQNGLGQFGSGWVWLVLENGQMKITKTPNGVNPLCFGQTALLGCDVWEHSYYIDYRNKRADYLKSFLDNLVNWEFVAQCHADGMKQAA